MSIEINNPGGGDCGFYAFTIGLIDVIQKEYEKNKVTKSSATFDLWLKNDNHNISLNDILKIDLNKLQKSPYSYQSELLNKLQMSLRAIAVNNIKSDLISNIKKQNKTEITEPGTGTFIENSNIFNKFMEIVQAFIKGESSESNISNIAKFNELALSKDVNNLAASTAKELIPVVNSDMPFKDKQVAIDKSVKKALLSDVLATNDLVSSSSMILKAVDGVKKQGRWATHDDLKELAQTFNINLSVNKVNDGVKKKSIPTIKLNNHDNAHWTTDVDFPAKKTPSSENKKTGYDEAVSALIAKHSFFSQKVAIDNRISINKIDDAVALDNESDEDFATRLQEVELRRSGYCSN